MIQRLGFIASLVGHSRLADVSMGSKNMAAILKLDPQKRVETDTSRGPLERGLLPHHYYRCDVAGGEARDGGGWRDQAPGLVKCENGCDYCFVLSSKS